MGFFGECEPRGPAALLIILPHCRRSPVRDFPGVESTRTNVRLAVQAQNDYNAVYHPTMQPNIPRAAL